MTQRRKLSKITYTSQEKLCQWVESCGLAFCNREHTQSSIYCPKHDRVMKALKAQPKVCLACGLEGPCDCGAKRGVMK